MHAAALIPQALHRMIAWTRDGQWHHCPHCHKGFGSHQVTLSPDIPARLYNRLSPLCPDCVAKHGSKLAVLTPPRPCACPDCGHIETSIAEMGRHWIAEHGRPSGP